MNAVSIFNRLVWLILLVIASTLLASVYGYFHNYITFSISPEYFTKFKFYQFSVLEYVVQDDDHLKASYVGIMATWWFGTVIGGILGLSSFFLSKINLLHFLKAILLCIGVTILFSFLGYLVGLYATEDLGFSAEFLNNLSNKKDFLTAGTMHNFSYLGGSVGLFAAILYLLRVHRTNDMTLKHPRRPSK